MVGFARPLRSGRRKFHFFGPKSRTTLEWQTIVRQMSVAAFAGISHCESLVRISIVHSFTSHLHSFTVNITYIIYHDPGPRFLPPHPLHVIVPKPAFCSNRGICTVLTLSAGMHRPEAYLSFQTGRPVVFAVFPHCPVVRFMPVSILSNRISRRPYNTKNQQTIQKFKKFKNPKNSKIQKKKK